MLKTRIKASQITNLTDARYFAARDVEWLGFNLDPGTENFIHPQNIKAIKEWLEGPKIVGEFGMQDSNEINAAIDFLNLDAVQVGMFADTSLLELKDATLIKEIVIENDTDYYDLRTTLESESSSVDIFLLNYSKNNLSWNSITSKHSTLKDLCNRFKIILSIDFELDQLNELLQTVQIHGLSLKGGEEEKVGFKSYDELDDILDALESD
jgi:phosphoribosylanthranilate isomerase